MQGFGETATCAASAPSACRPTVRSIVAGMQWFRRPERHAPTLIRLVRTWAGVADLGLWGSRIRPPVLTWDLGGPLIFTDEAAEDGPALDARLGEVGDRVVGPGRTELTAAMGTSS